MLPKRRHLCSRMVCSIGGPIQIQVKQFSCWLVVKFLFPADSGSRLRLLLEMEQNSTHLDHTDRHSDGRILLLIQFSRHFFNRYVLVDLCSILFYGHCDGISSMLLDCIGCWWSSLACTFVITAETIMRNEERSKMFAVSNGFMKVRQIFDTDAAFLQKKIVEE